MGWFSKGKVVCVNISKFSANFPDNKRRDRWFFELCSTNGSVWTIETCAREKECIERAQIFGKIFGFKVKRFGKSIRNKDQIELPKGRARRPHAS